MYKSICLTLLLIVSSYNAYGQNGLISVVTDAGHTLIDFTVSPDGNYLLTQGNGSIALWNIRTMQTIKVLPIYSSDPPRFGPGNPLIVYIRNSSINNNYEGYHILTGDFMGIKPEKDLMPRIIRNENIEFRKGKDVGSLQVYSRKTGRLMQTLTSKPMSSLGKIDLTEDDSLLLFTGMHPQIWNLRKARLERKLPFAEYVLSKDTSLIFRQQQIPVKAKEVTNSMWRQWCKGCFTADGNLMLGGHDDITTWTREGKLLKVQEVEGWPVFDWMDYNGQRYAATWRGGLQTGKIDDKKLKEVDNPQLMYFISGVMSNGKTYYSSDNEYLLFGNTQSSDLLYKNKYITAFVNSDLSTDRNCLLLSGELGNLKEVDSDANMFDYLSNAVFRWSRVNTARFLQGESHIVGGCSDGIIAMWQHKHSYPVWSTVAHRGQVMDILPTHHGKRFITSGSDGWSRIYDWEQQEEVMAMYSPEGTDDYLFLAPDNYYKGTKGVLSDIHFSKGIETFGLDQFDLQYNRPDIILQRMGGDAKEIAIMHKAWLKRVKRMGFTPDQLSTEFHVPECHFANAEDIPQEALERKLLLRLSAKDSQYQLNRIILYLNGVPLLGRHGLDISAKGKSKYEMDYELELTTGNNEITLSCINEKGAESNRRQLNVYYMPSDPIVPDLYLVALGVSQYEQEGFNLRYAAKDAQDFIHLMSTMLKSRFRNIHTFCLTDADVTPEIINRVQTFMKQSTREDVVMFYYAGHGLLDRQSNYYLSTYKTDFLEPNQNSIPFDQTEEWFDGIASLNRCCFIDACHSGELDKDDLLAGTQSVVPEGKISFRNATSTQLAAGQGVRQLNALLEDLFIDTRWGIGATIMSSAGGLEAAIEGDEWKNGLFTWCLRKGMSDPKADSNSNGELTMSELMQYLKKEVYRLSEGRQQPTLRSGRSNMNNFILK